MLRSEHVQTDAARSARIPQGPGPAVRQAGRQEGSEEHDGRGTFGPREESLPGRSSEAHGSASSAGSLNQTRKEDKAIIRAAGWRRLCGVARGLAVSSAQTSGL